MRKSLIVGIDDYPGAPLAGCVNDAIKMHNLLVRHHDGTPNFGSRKLVSSEVKITRSSLKEAVEQLFSGEPDLALLFFAGHGTFNNLGGYLVTQDVEKYDEGVAMQDILKLANQSKAREVVIILDCCHSGAFGAVPAIDNDKAFLRQGVSVLSACRESESAMEYNGGGLFTTLVCSALEGGGADVLGKVTIASLYAYVDQALGEWQQRPLFKSHVSKLVSIRNSPPDVPLEILRLLPGYFKSPIDSYQLDPSYEPDADPKHPEHEKIFSNLQKYRSARLLVPVGTEHMYYAAISSLTCRLTALGQFYWHLANSGRL